MAKLCWLLWYAVGNQQWESADRPAKSAATCWSVILKRMLGSGYPELIALAMTSSALTRKRAGRLGEGSAQYALRPDLFPFSDHDFLALPAGKGLLARQLLSRRDETLRAAAVATFEEGPGREASLLSAWHIMRTGALRRAVPRENRRDASVSWILARNRIDTFAIGTGRTSRRFYTPPVCLPRRFKERLKSPQGEDLIKWDWESHHFWLAASMLNGRARQEFERLVANQDLHSAIAERSAEATWTSPNYKSWLERERADDTASSRRNYTKTKANVYLLGEERRRSNSFTRTIEGCAPTLARAFESLRAKHGGPEHLMGKLYGLEQQYRATLLNDLHDHGVTFMLDEHDGMFIRATDLPVTCKALRRVQEAIGLEMKVKFTRAGEEIRPEAALQPIWRALTRTAQPPTH